MGCSTKMQTVYAPTVQQKCKTKIMNKEEVMTERKCTTEDKLECSQGTKTEPTEECTTKLEKQCKPASQQATQNQRTPTGEQECFPMEGCENVQECSLQDTFENGSIVKKNTCKYTQKCTTKLECQNNATSSSFGA